MLYRRADLRQNGGSWRRSLPSPVHQKVSTRIQAQRLSRSLAARCKGSSRYRLHQFAARPSHLDTDDRFAGGQGVRSIAGLMMQRWSRRPVHDVDGIACSSSKRTRGLYGKIIPGRPSCLEHRLSSVAGCGNLRRRHVCSRSGGERFLAKAGLGRGSGVSRVRVAGGLWRRSGGRRCYWSDLPDCGPMR
jgi:hypothetical protein